MSSKCEVDQNKNIRILLADDHKAVGWGLEFALKSENVEMLAVASRLDEIIPLFTRYQPDILILDIEFGEKNKNGLDILTQLLADFPLAKVIIFSQYDDLEIVEVAYKSGAMGYLTKVAEVEDIMEAILTVYKGELYFSSNISDRLARRQVGKENEEAESNYLKFSQSKADMLFSKEEIQKILTPREFVVFKLMAQGLTQAEIYQALQENHDVSLSVTGRTIANYGKKIKDKLGLKKSAEITLLAFLSGCVKAENIIKK